VAFNAILAYFISFELSFDKEFMIVMTLDDKIRGTLIIDLRKEKNSSD
jgi:hypothetical protein